MPPRVQTRKSVSLSGDTYRVLKRRCVAANVPLSSVVEALIAQMGDGPLPVKSPPPIEMTLPREPKPPRTSRVDVDVSDDLHTRVFELAFAKRTTMSAVFDDGLNRMLAHLESGGARCVDERSAA